VEGAPKRRVESLRIASHAPRSQKYTHKHTHTHTQHTHTHTHTVTKTQTHTHVQTQMQKQTQTTTQMQMQMQMQVQTHIHTHPPSHASPHHQHTPNLRRNSLPSLSHSKNKQSQWPHLFIQHTSHPPHHAPSALSPYPCFPL